MKLIRVLPFYVRSIFNVWCSHELHLIKTRVLEKRVFISVIIQNIAFNTCLYGKIEFIQTSTTFAGEICYRSYTQGCLCIWNLNTAQIGGCEKENDDL